MVVLLEVAVRLALEHHREQELLERVAQHLRLALEQGLRQLMGGGVLGLQQSDRWFIEGPFCNTNYICWMLNLIGGSIAISLLDPIRVAWAF